MKMAGIDLMTAAMGRFCADRATAPEKFIKTLGKLHLFT
jgi:hypothetical protein